MVSMMMKMSVITIIYIALVVNVWLMVKGKKLNNWHKLIIGIVFGLSSVASTHFGVSYENMVMNVRDIGPLAAGLFFSPISGIIAGLIGGIERYIAGTYFNVGAYTRIACSVSTCLAGFVAMTMSLKVFKGKKPSPFYAFFMGAVMEVFHMYVVFITHRNDMRMAFVVVSTCAVPMIIFTGLGMAVSSIMLEIYTKEWKNPFIKQEGEKIPVSETFQRWLFIITSVVIVGNFCFSYLLQTQAAFQECANTLSDNAWYIKESYLSGKKELESDSNVQYDIISEKGIVLSGRHKDRQFLKDEIDYLTKETGKVMQKKIKGERCHVLVEKIDDKT
ncbi:MAG: hypothetical protein IKN54_04050, partial [Lachnospiraceae bacterium]|nr:hypothetical protein [Lachnospiraceae bacterium]